MEVILLGATGSIGKSALEVVKKQTGKFRITAISANRNIDSLIKIATEFRVPKVIVTDENAPGIEKLKELSGVEILTGIEAAAEICATDSAGIVLNAVVGSAGYLPTKKALVSGKTVALANKETLVAFGDVINKILERGTGRIIPVDSEHSAVFQLIEGRKKDEIASVILTASGGSLRNHPDPENASVEDVLKHPTWNMGAKITVDSATLANKGLEVIEAARLFGMKPERIKVIVHPTSIVHSLVELTDGSILAQLAVPDMKLPIQYALNYPDRQDRFIKSLPLHKVSPLEFFEPEKEKFPCLSHAYEALEAGGTMPAVFNAGNEEAVGLFLKKKIKFGRISKLIREVMDNHITGPATEDAVFKADEWARRYVLNSVESI
ncbi:1-deoxy-D-xylulose-5-phosphate reductoisomerase [candidate division WOR-3 bacterium]|nr:1-deoxy-D-xylulose-5-phosphate reductoisomerase [candidate division WOR-3 bacterium]